jgi:hypothetical protein
MIHQTHDFESVTTVPGLGSANGDSEHPVPPGWTGPSRHRIPNYLPCTAKSVGGKEGSRKLPLEVDGLGKGEVMSREFEKPACLSWQSFLNQLNYPFANATLGEKGRGGEEEAVKDVNCKVAMVGSD